MNAMDRKPKPVGGRTDGRREQLVKGQPQYTTLNVACQQLGRTPAQILGPSVAVALKLKLYGLAVALLALMRGWEVRHGQ